MIQPLLAVLLWKMMDISKHEEDFFTSHQSHATKKVEKTYGHL